MNGQETCTTEGTCQQTSGVGTSRKLCFVVQRYGLEVNGGAELLCRQVAERAAQRCEVHVFTTKAIDYISWRDEYPDDIEILNGVTIHRFPVAKERERFKFRVMSYLFRHGCYPASRGDYWIREQGPYCPALIEALRESADDYDAFIFNTYLYYPSVVGIPVVSEKAIFVPDAHDEPYLRFGCVKREFESAAGFFFNTEEERLLAEERFDIQGVPSDIGGVGIEVPPHPAPEQFREKFGIEGPYIIYVGRIDKSKGCDEMLRYWDEYKRRHPEQLTLILLGKSVMDIPERDDVRALGFVSEEDKFAGIEGAEFLLLPSKFESLSIVVLEALSLGVPVLVNGDSPVLRGHCERSGAGLYYKGYEDFDVTAAWLLSDAPERSMMRWAGPLYVSSNYQWDHILDKLFALIDRVIAHDED